MEYSKKRQARAKEAGVDIKQLAVAELMAWGWSDTDAMLVVGMLKDTDSRGIAQHAALTYTTDEKFNAAFRKRCSQIKNGAVFDEYQKIHPTPGSSCSNKGRKRTDGGTRALWRGDAPEPISDEEILSTMWETIAKLKADDPKRVDLLDKYDKLKRRQGAGDDDTTIHFYLPRPECDTCPFRGGHIITDPEPEPQTEKEDVPEEETQRDDDINIEEWPEDEPIPSGYSKKGKKLGRPRKKRNIKPVIKNIPDKE